MKSRTCIARVCGLVGLVSAGCSLRQSHQDWVLEQPQPVVLSNTKEVDGLALERVVIVGEVRAGAGLSAYAGDISGPPTPLPVPFSSERPALVVLRADLERMLAPVEGRDLLRSDARPLLVLDVTLEYAFVHRTYHVVKSSEMVAGVVFDAKLTEPKDGATVWAERVRGEHSLRPTYITGESVERALNAAYGEALMRLGSALVAATGAR